MRTLARIALLFVWAALLAWNLTNAAQAYRDGEWWKFGWSMTGPFYALLAIGLD